MHLWIFDGDERRLRFTYRDEQFSRGAYRLLPFGLLLEPTRTDGGKIRTWMESLGGGDLPLLAVALEHLEARPSASLVEVGERLIRLAMDLSFILTTKWVVASESALARARTLALSLEAPPFLVSSSP
eukprot:scaffold18693_cov101-Isochrysis_galbana.AAC.3